MDGWAYDGDGVLADILEPHELESAGSKTVDTLLLVLADDDVEERGAGFEEEDGVGVTYAIVLAKCFSYLAILVPSDMVELTSFAVIAGTRASVVFHPAGIEGLSSRDPHGGREGLGSRGSWDAAFVAEAG